MQTSRSARLSLSVNLMQSSLLSIHPFSASCRRRRRVSISLFKRVLSYEKIKSVLQCYLTMTGKKHEETRRKNGDGDNCNDGNNDNNDKAYNDVDHDDKILMMMMMMMMMMMITIHIDIRTLLPHELYSVARKANISVQHNINNKRNLFKLPVRAYLI